MALISKTLVSSIAIVGTLISLETQRESHVKINDYCMKFQYSAITSFWQRAEKVMSNSQGLVDFVIGLVNSVFNLPDRQVIFFEQLE